MSEKAILLISSGMIVAKKYDNPFAQKHLYLNYGLLTLGSILAEKGFSPQIFHGNFNPPTNLTYELEQRGLLNSKFPLLLSVPSSFSLGWAREFCLLVKRINKKIKIILGGRWVVGFDSKWISDLIPEIDLIVFGMAEDRIVQLLYIQNWDKIPNTNLTGAKNDGLMIKSFPQLKYDLVENYMEYQPSIEISRGCGLGCLFCVERNDKRIIISNPNGVISGIKNLLGYYNYGVIHPYFEASYFQPSIKWTTEFNQFFQEQNFKISWRCETRVDGIPIKILELLVNCGLKVVDLGLESASHNQLFEMNKTKNPKKYLIKAAEFLEKCKELNIWVKINILLFAGETKKSIMETVKWLLKYRDCIKGVSVNPLVLYRSDMVNVEYINRLKNLGAYPINGSLFVMQNGYDYLNLSPELDHDSSKKLSLDICKLFMDEKDYFDLKSFSYFPRSFTFESFIESVQSYNHTSLPFRIKFYKQ